MIISLESLAKTTSKSFIQSVLEVHSVAPPCEFKQIHVYVW